MKPNQFTITEDEVERIKEANKLLPKLEKTCYKCGHKPCPLCGNWCDYMMSHVTWSGNWSELDEDDVNDEGKVFPPHACCEMECSYV